MGTSYLTLIESLLGAIEWGPDLVDLLLQQEPGLRWIKVVGQEMIHGKAISLYIYISISIYLYISISTFKCTHGDIR